jgi:hypothetical protein
MRKALALILALGLVACSAIAVPKTPAQTVYALEGAYAAAARAELAYTVSPHADPGTVEAIRKADTVAYDALVAAQKAVQSGQSAGGRAGAQFKESGGKAAEAAALSAAQDGISALVALLHSKGLI